MGPSNVEQNHTTSSAMISVHGIATNGDAETPQVAAINVASSGKRLSCSSFTSCSSSPDSPLDDPFRDDIIEAHELNAQLDTTPKLEQPNHELPISTLPPEGNITPITESPPIQEMERSDESSYRIPSSVFARAKSTSPVDWSVASNESLFSIHMGNMSFSKDPMFWHSEGLGTPGEPSTSGQLFPPIDEAMCSEKGSMDFRVADETLEVQRESAEDQNIQNVNTGTNFSCCSDESSTSMKSFAFPILSGCMETGASGKKTLGSAKMGSEKIHSEPEPQSPTQQPISPTPKSPANTPENPGPIWSSCFSCCTSRT